MRPTLTFSGTPHPLVTVFSADITERHGSSVCYLSIAGVTRLFYGHLNRPKVNKDTFKLQAVPGTVPGRLKVYGAPGRIPSNGTPVTGGIRQSQGREIDLVSPKIPTRLD